MEFHPYALIFPPLSPDELQELADDIKKNGQRESIKILDGKIIDGRHRFQACGLVKVKPFFEELAEDTDPLAYVVSANLKRRHLNTGQRAILAAQVANMQPGQRRFSAAGIPAADQNSSEKPPVSQPEAAKMFGTSRSAVQDVNKLKATGDPKLIEDVQEGRKTLNQAAQIAEERKHWCGRCKRIGKQAVGCAQCAENERKAAAGPQKEKSQAEKVRDNGKKGGRPSANGQAQFRIEDFTAALGKVVRMLDVLAREHGLVNRNGSIAETPAHLGIRRTLDEAEKATKDWYKRLKKESKK